MNVLSHSGKVHTNRLIRFAGFEDVLVEVEGAGVEEVEEADKAHNRYIIVQHAKSEIDSFLEVSTRRVLPDYGDETHVGSSRGLKQEDLAPLTDVRVLYQKHYQDQSDVDPLCAF